MPAFSGETAEGGSTAHGPARQSSWLGEAGLVPLKFNTLRTRYARIWQNMAALPGGVLARPLAVPGAETPASESHAPGTSASAAVCGGSQHGAAPASGNAG